jgi:ATP-binding cassette subfamily F protein uup
MAQNSINYLSVENITKNFGARALFQNLSFGIAEGEKVALIARNGSGKTTIFNILSGQEQPDAGRVTYRKGLAVEFLAQEPNLDPKKTILDSVLASNNAMTEAIVKYDYALLHPENTDAYQQAFDEMERAGAWDFENQVKQVLGKLGFNDTSLKVETLSGGQKKRVALAKVLISKPDLLVLDEPTNHLDIDMIEWLEEYLTQKGLALLMVTHDRYFLERVCTTILELEGEDLYRHPGSYSKFLERKAERQQVEATNVDKAKNLMRKELEWIRRQPKARGTKSKARIDSFQDLKKEAGKDLRESELQLDVKMTRLGSKILELHNLRKSYGSKKILNGFSHTFKRAERVGIVGANGAGKSTFLKLITGHEEPDGGKIVVGDTIKFGFYTQSGMNLKDDQRVIDVVRDIAEYIPLAGKGGDLSASQLLERFLFEGDQQYSFVSKLSGGEKRRLYLLTILMDNPNFLILDEPTNDLDILTLNILEDFLMDFQGCLMVVTHDRYFMDKLTDHLFVFEGEGKVRDFPGNYSDYRLKKADEEFTAKLKEQSQVKSKNTAAKSSASAEAKTPKTKLTYAEKLELEDLEKDLEKLELRKADIAQAFESATSDAAKLEELSREMNALTKELETKEMRWLELSEYAE